MRGRLLVVAALLLPACSGGAMDARAMCEQTFGREELDGSVLTTVGEVRARHDERWTAEMRGAWPEIWPGKPDDARAVWCLLRRADVAVTEGEQPVKFPRSARTR